MKVGFRIIAEVLGDDTSSERSWWPPLSPAAHAVRQAQTKEEFGAALDLLRRSGGLSLNVLTKRLADARQWIVKSTLSRACSGRTLFRDRDKVAAFVTACGAEPEIEIWQQAWERANAHTRRTSSSDDKSEHAGVREELDCPDDDAQYTRAEPSGDDAVEELRVPCTARHVRAAIVLVAAAGFTLSETSSTPHQEAMVHLVAVRLALDEFLLAMLPTSVDSHLRSV